MNNNKEYLIFSDESGHWAQPKKYDFYVRSWILIPTEKYEYLEFQWEKKKVSQPTAKSLLKNGRLINNFLKWSEGDIKIFFSFTYLQEFYKRGWMIRDEVSRAVSKLEFLIKREYEKKIPSKLMNALNHVLFLYVYEKHHLRNAIDALIKTTPCYIEFCLNKPQFSNEDYLEIFQEIKTKKGINAKMVFLSDKENKLGLKLADSLAEIFRKALENDKNSISFLKEKILHYGVAGNIGVKGINKVMYPVNKSYKNDLLESQERVLIENLRNFFI